VREMAVGARADRLHPGGDLPWNRDILLVRELFKRKAEAE
jgi:hypothetical protein